MVEKMLLAIWEKDVSGNGLYCDHCDNDLASIHDVVYLVGPIETWYCPSCFMKAFGIKLGGEVFKITSSIGGRIQREHINIKISDLPSIRNEFINLFLKVLKDG